jgi:hypothetical protein
MVNTLTQTWSRTNRPMISYALTCEKAHRFDSWFRSGADFDNLMAANRVTCGICGSAQVSKAMMAPAVTTDRPDRPLSTAKNPAEQALAELRKRIEENSEYVGLSFAAEARAIHDGDAPERSIYGEARAEDARALIEDGVPVAPLPFTPKRRTN